MTSQANPAGEAERRISEIERRIQEARSQPGRKGAEKRAQIPGLQAQIESLRSQLSSGQFSSDIQAQAARRAANGPGARAPAGSLSARNTNTGGRPVPSSLPGSVRPGGNLQEIEQDRQLRNRLEQARASGRAQEVARLENQIQSNIEADRRNERARILAEQQATGQFTPGGLSSGDSVGAPQRDIPFRTVEGRTQTVFDVNEVDLVFDASPEFAGKASTIPELQVESANTTVLVQNDDGFSTSSLNAIVRPAEDFDFAVSQSAQAIGADVGESAVERRIRLLGTVTPEQQADIDIIKAQVAAGVLFKEGKGTKNPFFPGQEVVKVDNILFTRTPELLPSKQKTFDETFDEETEQKIKQAQGLRRSIKQQDIDLFKTQRQNQKDILVKFDSYVEALESGDPNRSKQANQSQQSQNAGGEQGHTFLKRAHLDSVSFSSDEVLRAHNVDKKAKVLNNLSIKQRAKSAFLKENIRPLFASPEEIGTSIFVGAVTLRVGSFVAPLATQIVGTGLVGASATARTVKATYEIKAGADPVQVIAGEGPKILGETLIAGAGARSSLKGLSAPRLQKTSVRQASIASKKTSVVRRTGAERFGEPTQVEVRQTADILAQTETTQKALLGKPKVIGTRTETLRVTSQGKGLAADNIIVVKGNVKGQRLKTDFTRLVSDEARQLSLPTLQPTGNGAKVGQQVFKIQQVNGDKVLIGETVIRTPNYAKLTQRKGSKVSQPLQTEVRRKTFGKLQDFDLPTGQKGTRSLRLVTVEGEALVKSNRPFFDKKQAKKVFNIPEGKPEGVAAGVAVKVAEVESLPARKVIKPKRIVTKDVLSAETGKPVLDATIFKDTGKIEGGVLSEFKGAEATVSVFDRASTKGLSVFDRPRTRARSQAGPRILNRQPLLENKSNVLGKTPQSNIISKQGPRVDEPRGSNLLLRQKSQSSKIVNKDLASQGLDNFTAKQVSQRLLGKTTRLKVPTSPRLAGLLGAKAGSVLTTKSKASPITKIIGTPRASPVQKLIGKPAPTNFNVKQIPGVDTGRASRTTTTPRQTQTTKTRIPGLDVPTPTTPNRPDLRIPPPGIPFGGRSPGQSGNRLQIIRDPYKGVRKFKVATPKQFRKLLLGR